MSPIDDRRRLVEHMHICWSCPTDPCDKGLELAAAVRDGVYSTEEKDRDFGRPGWYERTLRRIRRGSDYGPFDTAS